MSSSSSGRIPARRFILLRLFRRVMLPGSGRFLAGFVLFVDVVDLGIYHSRGQHIMRMIVPSLGRRNTILVT